MSNDSIYYHGGDPRGPQPSETPDDYSDLHDNNGAYPTGAPPDSGLTDDTGRGFRVGSNAPLGYYTNPPTSASANPNNDGAGVFRPGEQGCADSIAAALDALYADRMDNLQPTNAPDPYTDP